MIYPDGFEEYQKLKSPWYGIVYSSFIYGDLDNQRRIKDSKILEFESKHPYAKYWLCRYYFDNPPGFLTFDTMQNVINLTVLNPGHNSVIKNYGY